MAIHYVNSVNENLDTVKELISKLRSGVTRIGLDTETNGLDPFTNEVLLVQIGIDDEVYVLNRGRIGLPFFVSLFNLINERNIVCVGHNIKFDMKMIKCDTDVWLKKAYCTQTAESVLTAGVGEKLYSLANLVMKYYYEEMDKEVRLQFIGMRQGDSFTEQQITYGAKDILYLTGIMDIQLEKCQEAKLGKIFELEMKLLPVVAKMEHRGITLDVDHWNKLTDDAEVNLIELERKLKASLLSHKKLGKYENAYDFATALAIPVKTKRDTLALQSITDQTAIVDWAVEKFNMGSHKQLLTVLNLVGIKVKNTNEKTLRKLESNEIIDLILEYRDFEKRLSTYGRNIIELINPVTGRIHTEYFQVGTQTGRFSSTNPNMQNIPTHNGYREGFVARPGYSFMAIDYSQQEYRLAGALSKEQKIIEAYLNGFDMHTATAAIRYNKKFEDVTKDERSKGKTINFAVLYGTTEFGLKKNLQISIDDAVELLKNFFAGYPRLTAFKKAVEDTIVKLGYSITPMGRRRYFKELPPFATPKDIETHISKMKREGFNMVIQGGGADVTKLAMVALEENNPFPDGFFPLLQVHDEIVAEVEDSILDEALKFMKSTMENAFQPFLGEIPAVVDAKISKVWTKS